MVAELAVEREPIAASTEEQVQIDAVERLLAGDGKGSPALIAPDGNRAALPESLLRVLRQAVKALAHHDAVAVIAVHKLLTTQEAADLLTVSRPYLVRLLDRGDLPATHVGSHRRLRLDDVLTYKHARDGKRRDALRELTRMNQEYGLYERH